MTGRLKNDNRLIRFIVFFVFCFSDENSEEDFEDWDSIGLNVSKPPNLLRLYRDFKRHVVPSKVTLDQSIQTSPGDKKHIEICYYEAC